VSLVDVDDRIRHRASIYYKPHRNHWCTLSSRHQARFVSIWEHPYNDMSSSDSVTVIFCFKVSGWAITSVRGLERLKGPKVVSEFGGGLCCWVLFHARIKSQDRFYNASEIP
jgi:hypothetical protein